RLEAIREGTWRSGKARAESFTSKECGSVHRRQRKAERRVRQLPQGLSRQRRHRGKWSDSMPAVTRGEMIMRLMPLKATAIVLFVSGSLFAQEWIEFASREDRFTCNFPSEPKMTQTTYHSQMGADLPARVYSAAQGQSRYSITVVDYNQAQRLLTE